MNYHMEWMRIMTDNHDRTVVTESSQEDGSIRISSMIQLETGLQLIVESVWMPDVETMRLHRDRLAVRIGNLVFPLTHGPTLAAHLEAARKAFPEVIDDGMSQKEAVVPEGSVRKVYLATTSEASEVFLDPTSAAFWASDKSQVREISMDTAMFVLKTDEASVIASAVQASRSSWQAIQVITAIASFAEELRKRIREMGFSITELTDAAERVLGAYR